MFRFLRFDNVLARELPGDPEKGPRLRQVHGALWSAAAPTPVAAPRLIAWSRSMAERLGLSDMEVESPEFAAVFGGNALVDGMRPYATNYGGHQFGHWAGQLGDGRAIALGETVDARGRRCELQLKGAGPTPYSRNADGRAVLRSSIREFLCSEAMHHLGVPTTRALSLVGTGETVVRDMLYDGHPQAEPGAIVCRAAPSFLRFGHFELPASRGDVALLRRLADVCIWRDFAELLPGPSRQPFADRRANGCFDEALYSAWFARICERTAVMVAHWMRVGFVHGVMNTDNMSILGLTIDYGPYGWLDDYDPDWTPNTTDAEGRRYRFGWQPKIARWNLTRLAQALSPLFSAADALHAGLRRFDDVYLDAERDGIARKLGLSECRDDDVALMRDLHAWMRAAEVDMTVFFRALADVNIETDTQMGAATLMPVPGSLNEAFYDHDKRMGMAAQFDAWWRRYDVRLRSDGLPMAQRRARMRAANPRFVLRNYLAQQAIDRAHEGDDSGIAELLEVMRRPYDDQPGRENFAGKRPEWARDRVGCSMLSCSS